jgi:hypothetical protein
MRWSTKYRVLGTLAVALALAACQSRRTEQAGDVENLSEPLGMNEEANVDNLADNVASGAEQSGNVEAPEVLGPNQENQAQEHFQDER